MKIRLTRNTIVDGKALSIGDVVETTEETGQFLISIKKAELVVETAEPPEEEKSAEPPEEEKSAGKKAKGKGSN